MLEKDHGHSKMFTKLHRKRISNGYDSRTVFKVWVPVPIRPVRFDTGTKELERQL